ILGAGLLTAAAIAGQAWAAQPTQADMDFCNRQATAGQSSAAGAGQPTARRGDAGAGAAHDTGSGTSPTGGRITDASRPGVDAAPGMARLGETDAHYRQEYINCLQQRAH